MSGPIFRSDISQNTSEWFALRLAIPTSSEMKRIVTPTGARSSQVVAYRNRLLWEYVSGVPFQEEDAYQSLYMEHGHEYEAAAVKSFELMTSKKAEKVGFVSTWEGLLGASPDRIVESEACLEIKSPTPPIQIKYLLDKDSLVAEYRCQLQAQLYICEFDKQYICADNPKLPPVILEVGRDEKFIAAMVGYCREFVDTMLEKRLELEQKFGPFKRPTDKSPAAEDPDWLSEADVDAILGTAPRKPMGRATSYDESAP